MKDLVRYYPMSYVQLHWLSLLVYLQQRHYYKQFTREGKPIQLDHNDRLPFILRKTDRGEDFILYEDDPMIIFTCEKNLSVLQEFTHWFMDGAFSDVH